MWIKYVTLKPRRQTIFAINTVDRKRFLICFLFAVGTASGEVGGAGACGRQSRGACNDGRKGAGRRTESQTETLLVESFGECDAGLDLQADHLLVSGRLDGGLHLLILGKTVGALKWLDLLVLRLSILRCNYVPLDENAAVLVLGFLVVVKETAALLANSLSIIVEESSTTTTSSALKIKPN